MIIKRLPDDFVVEELTDHHFGAGPFALYRLEKKGWTTPDALAAVRRRWRIDQHRLSYGGLKDRHAHTVQYFTIHYGPEQNLEDGTFTVTFLGRVAEPYSSQQIRANGFTITLRGLTPS